MFGYIENNSTLNYNHKSRHSHNEFKENMRTSMVFGQEQCKSMHKDNVSGKFFKGYTDLVLSVALYSNKQYIMDLHNNIQSKVG